MSYYLGDNIQKIIQIKRIVNKYSAKSELSACLELTCGIANFVNFNYYNGHNIALGSAVVSSLVGANNIVIGYQALPHNIRNNCNISIGYEVIPHNTTSNCNIINHNIINYNTTNKINQNNAIEYTDTVNNTSDPLDSSNKADLINKADTSYSLQYLFKFSDMFKKQIKPYKVYNSIKDLIDYPVMLYVPPQPHKYTKSYNLKSGLCEMEDTFLELGYHNSFVKILFIKRFMEKYTHQVPLAAPLEMTHMIFGFIHDEMPPIIITAEPINFIRISDGVLSFDRYLYYAC